MNQQLKLALIIDEDFHARKSLESVLTDLGYGVIVASTAKEGIHLTKIHKPHIIICSVNLPNNEGYSVVQAIKTDRSINGSLVICSTDKADEDFGYGFNLGADDYLMKPFNVIDVVKTITVVVLKHQQFGKKAGFEFIQSMNTLLLHVLPHEIRTPLNAIVGCIDYLIDEVLHEAAEQYQGMYHEHLSGVLRTLSCTPKIGQVA